MSNILLEMKDITKTFPGVKALCHVNLRVAEGEIHALMGENGAGKSTLMKVLSGVYEYGSYEGDILFENKICQFKQISDSEVKGIVIIHQELALIPQLSISENIFLGNEQAKRGVINWHETDLATIKLLDKVGLVENPATPAGTIGVGKQQLVEIAKALSKKVKLLILDEPTAALNEEDSENLLELLLQLKAQGLTSIIISHKLNEIMKVADAITILRDGQTVETLYMNKDNISEERIIKGMVGRDITQRYPIRTKNITNVCFEIKNWTVSHPIHTDRTLVDNVSFNLKKGEIVGIAGLMGSGRTELAMNLFGRSYGIKRSGQMIKDDVPIDVKSVSDAINHGIAYVSEDRKEYGLILIDDIKHNITLANTKEISKFNVVNEYRELIEAEFYKERLKIKTPSVHQITGNLSGGNQQKVVLSKWIFAGPDILILDEPTRGIDVGAKFEIYTIINQLANEGKAILMISSELPELLGMCDRIYVMNEGKFTGEVSQEEATQELLMKYMTKGR